jgi:16S rRNA processing protein RimM
MTKKKQRTNGRSAAAPSSAPRPSSRNRSKAQPVPRRGRELLREREDFGFKSQSDLVTVGRLGRPWGVHGAINVRLHDPDDELSWAGEVVWLQGEGFPARAVEIEKFVEKGSKVLLQFAGVRSPQDVSALTHLDVRVPRDWLPEPEPDEHYVQDLIGMEVVDVLRGPLGRIERVFTTGANDVWVVKGKSREELIPAIKQVVLEVDHEARSIRVQYELI